MHLIIEKTEALFGEVTVPSSKSQSIRGIFFATLSSEKSFLFNVLGSEDTREAIRVCQHLGADISNYKDGLRIEGIAQGVLMGEGSALFVGSSGATTRFVLPLLGLRRNPYDPVLLDCSQQMRARPIAPLVDALIQLGLSIEYANKKGFCPLIVSGSLEGGKVEMDGTSSQHVSALLMALPCVPKDSEIRVKQLCGRPYVNMTLEWLNKQGIHYSYYKEPDIDLFKIQGGQEYKGFNASINGDFSSASYLIAAGILIPGCIKLFGLDMKDAQGDKRLIPILQSMGADILVEPKCITLRGRQRLEGIKVDASDIPDLLPTLAVIGTQAEGKTQLVNVKHARTKETDRIHSMVVGLRELGAKIEEYEDGLTVYPSKLIGSTVKGFSDHRTVMALAIAGMLAEGRTVIEGREAIDKTFPTFVEVMKSMGANLL